MNFIASSHGYPAGPVVAGRAGGKFTILVVDGGRHQQNAIIQSFEQLGYQTIRAATGKQALQHVLINETSLMILDLMLPDMSGIEVCRRIKQSDQPPPSLGIIVISASNSEEDEINVLNMGADDYIPKPFSISVLLARVQTVLNRSSLIE